MSRAILLACMLGLTACLTQPTVPVTTVNSAQVQGCESNADWHNASWLAAGVFAAGGAGLGTAGTLTSDTNTQHALAGAAIATSVLAGGAVALEAVTAANYTSAGCSNLVTPLQSTGKSARIEDIRWAPGVERHDLSFVRVQTPRGPVEIDGIVKVERP